MSLECKRLKDFSGTPEICICQSYMKQAFVRRAAKLYPHTNQVLPLLPLGRYDYAGCAGKTVRSLNNSCHI